MKVDLIYDGRMVVELTGDIATRVARLVTVSDIASDLIRSMSERQADDGPGPSIMYRLMRLAAEDA